MSKKQLISLIAVLAAAMLLLAACGGSSATPAATEAAPGRDRSRYRGSH